MTEDELRKFASEAARDRDAAVLYALTEAHLTLHGSSGFRVSSYTLSDYRHAVGMLPGDWRSENLMRPSRTAGVLWVRELEGVELAQAVTRGDVRLPNRGDPSSIHECVRLEVMTFSWLAAELQNAA